MIGRQCPKCPAKMEPGFMAEYHQGDEGRQVAWHPGSPKAEQVSFLGIDVSTSWLVRLDTELLEPVTQYRCSGCGYIEAYAH